MSSDDDDAHLIKKNPKGKYSRSSRDDDDSSADEPVFASIGERSSADSGFAEVKSNSLTHYLYLSSFMSTEV